MQQELHRFDLAATLMAHFARRDDVLICGGGYVRNVATSNAEQLAPDLLVTFGVRPDAIISRNGYVISEVGKPPDWVIEVASRATGRRDYTVKREAYAAYGIGEYWRFDHTGGRFHDAPLAGDQLIGGRYERIELIREPRGLIWGHSPTLGLDICWDDGDLRLRDPLTGEFLPDAAESQLRIDNAEARGLEDRIARETAESNLDAALEDVARLRNEITRLRRLRRSD